MFKIYAIMLLADKIDICQFRKHTCTLTISMNMWNFRVLTINDKS